MSKAIIIMGSKGDIEHARKISSTINKFGVECVLRVASAHKVPLKVLEIIKEYGAGNVVFITIAGRSNALSGFVDANTTKPIIACPPYSDKFAGADVFSSLRMPSGVCPMVVLEPEQAALAALKILGVKDERLEEKIREEQERKKNDIEEADTEVVQHG